MEKQADDQFALTDITIRHWWGHRMWSVRQAFALLECGRLPGCPGIAAKWNDQTLRRFVNGFGATILDAVAQAMLEPNYQVHRTVWIDYWMKHNNSLPKAIQAMIDSEIAMPTGPATAESTEAINHNKEKALHKTIYVISTMDKLELTDPDTVSKIVRWADLMGLRFDSDTLRKNLKAAEKFGQDT